MSTNSGDNWDLVGNVPGVKGWPSPVPGYTDMQDEGGIMTRARNFYDRAHGAWEENRRMHSEDLNFIYNAEAMGQWDPVVIQNRRGKPCYTFNRCIGPVNIAVADMRQTRPDGKVRPASDGASEPVAEIFGGLCRSIEQASRADQIYKEQYKYAVAGGFGAWRAMPTYMTDTGDGAFDQVIRIINIANPQTVLWDPQCADACAGDANQCMVAERISEDVYHAQYRDSNGQSLQFSRDSYGWYTDKEIRIAEYFERVPFDRHIAKMTDGTVVDYDETLRKQEDHFDEHGIGNDADGPQANRVAKYPNGKRMVRKTIEWKVMWVKIDGSNILEGPMLYNWKRIPVIRCPGRYVNIEGRKKFQSLIRHAKDAQRSYNSRASDMIERSALIPKAPYLVTETMIKGYENEWAQANVASRPYLPYNVDPKAPEGGMPFKIPAMDLPQGAVALAQMSIQDIQATIGFYDPALGNAEDMNRVSGKALVTHTKRSDLGSYEFVDGFGAALQLTWEIMIDMIPSVYDAQRVERIIGRDGMEKEVTLNHLQGDDSIINDLKQGTYGVTVTIGPNYQTQRQETLATLIDAAEAMPMVAQFCPDLLVKNIDSPDAAEMARRLRIPLIQNGTIQPTEDEKKQLPQQPNPQQVQQQQEAALLKAKVDKMTADATVAGVHANNAPLQHQKQIYETAGKHLGNVKLAHEIGADRQAAATAQQAEQQAMQQDAQAHQQGQQQDAQAHQQDQQQQGQQHVADLTQQHQAHVAELLKQRSQHEADTAHAHARHQQDLQHAAEKHATALQHAKEMGEAKVAVAKAVAAAKPKKPKKAS